MGEYGDEEAAEIYWPGSLVALKFNGTSLSATLEDQHGDNYFNVIVDGMHVAVLHLSAEPKNLFIEFYGNSITTGYGNEDFTGEDKPTGDVTNNDKAYGSLTARNWHPDQLARSHHVRSV